MEYKIREIEARDNKAVEKYLTSDDTDRKDRDNGKDNNNM